MAEQTAISWTDHTFNPWWGCWKIADECKNCYADELANRYAPGLWGRTAPRRFFGDKHWNEPRAWNKRAAKKGVRERVFVASMSDWAEVHPVPEINAQLDAARDRLWTLAQECDWLDWLFLTKRIDDASKHLPWCRDGSHDAWPNVWLGVTAGTRESLAKNVPILRSIPAAVRFISCEPLLEYITRAEWTTALMPMDAPIHWLIVGNESGSKRRSVSMDAVRVARDVATQYGVRFHFKQWVPEKGNKIHLPVLDGRQWAEFPTESQP